MRLKAELWLFVVTLLWAGTFSIIKPTLEFISPMIFVSTRFVLAGIILFVIFKTKLFSITKQSLIGGFWLGIFLFAGFVVQTIGLQYTTATKSALITGTFVVWTPILSTIIERKPPKPGNVIGIIVVLIGLLLLASSKESIFTLLKNLGSDFNIGDLLTLICAIFFAAYIVYLDMIANKTEYLHLVWLQIVVTAVGAFIFIFIFNLLNIEPPKFVFNSQVILTILYTTIFATLITTFLQTKYQPFTTPTRAAVIFTCEPLLASLLAYILLNESIGAIGLVGGALIIIGILTSEFFDSLVIKKDL